MDNGRGRTQAQLLDEPDLRRRQLWNMGRKVHEYRFEILVYVCWLMAQWSFLTNHTHVLLCIAHDPDSRLRDIADAVGITERATHRIVTELVEAGYVSRERVGRRNKYEIHPERRFDHPTLTHPTLTHPAMRERTMAEVLSVFFMTGKQRASKRARVRVGVSQNSQN